MATTPLFGSTVRFEYINTATANTARDGTGTFSALITGVAAGTRVLELVYEFAATTTAGNVKWAISLDSGTTKRLFDEWPVAALTPSATVQPARMSKTYENLILRNASAQIYVAPHNAESINCFAMAVDLT